jgi:hypothetical protein
MDFDTLEVVQIGHMPLSQKKFKDGELIVSGIKDDKEFIAIDVRFYLLKEDGWLPTKTGFWVDKGNWKSLQEVLSKSPESIGETVCWKNETRKFIVRYTPDYGSGVDFRYFSETKKYTGWEKKGIRITQNDYSQVTKLILGAMINPENMSCDTNINVIQGEKKKKRYVENSSSNIFASKSVNPALIELLGWE